LPRRSAATARCCRGSRTWPCTSASSSAPTDGPRRSTRSSGPVARSQRCPGRHRDRGRAGGRPARRSLVGRPLDLADQGTARDRGSGRLADPRGGLSCRSRHAHSVRRSRLRDAAGAPPLLPVIGRRGRSMGARGPRGGERSGRASLGTVRAMNLEWLRVVPLGWARCAQVTKGLGSSADRSV
jgi:hypothetical protein